jgi:LysM repeat protein
MYTLWYLVVFVILAILFVFRQDPDPQKTQKPEPSIEQFEHYYKTHTVKKGESLSLIAGMYGVDLQELVTMNGIKDKDLIKAGMAIKIPRP